MAMNLAPMMRQRFFDANGNPLVGGKLYSYQAGTTTPQVTYCNATGTTNTNPVILDSSGYADVWLDSALAYKLVLTDADGVTIWTVDNVTFPVGLTTWNANSVYQTGSMVIDTSGKGVLYVSLIDNNQNNALTNVSAWRLQGGNVRTVSSNTVLLVTDDVVRSNSTAGALTHTLPAIATTSVGKTVTVKDVGNSTYATTVAGNSSDLIDGAATFVIDTGYDSATFFNNGTSWDVI